MVPGWGIMGVKVMTSVVGNDNLSDRKEWRTLFRRLKTQDNGKEERR